MTDSAFTEAYDTLIFYLEDGDDESYEAMDWENLRELSEQEIANNDSCRAHYLLSLYHYLKGDEENQVAELLKAAYRGHWVAAIDYATKRGSDGTEILGIAKAMTDAGQHLAYLSEDVHYYIDKLDPQKPEDVAKKAEIETIATRLEQYMAERNLQYTC